MKTEERNAWLLTLNVGDEVAYSGGGLYSSVTIATIASISPSRRFNLSNGTTINSDGSVRGNNHFYIRPVTEKIKQDIWRQRAITKLRVNLKIDKLSNEQLKVLLEML
jgi:hypothetical protein